MEIVREVNSYQMEIATAPRIGGETPHIMKAGGNNLPEDGTSFSMDLCTQKRQEQSR